MLNSIEEVQAGKILTMVPEGEKVLLIDAEDEAELFVLWLQEGELHGPYEKKKIAEDWCRDDIEDGPATNEEFELIEMLYPASVNHISSHKSALLGVSDGLY